MMSVRFRLVDAGASIGIGVCAFGNCRAYRFRNPFFRLWTK